MVVMNGFEWFIAYTCIIMECKCPKPKWICVKFDKWKKFKNGYSKHLNNIISCNIINFDQKINKIEEYMDQQVTHPCTTRTLNVNDINFHGQFEQGFHNLMDICNHGFLQTLIQETHFEHGHRLLHIKRNDRWLNNDLKL
jgi:hypothetical protein